MSGLFVGHDWNDEREEPQLGPVALGDSEPYTMRILCRLRKGGIAGGGFGAGMAKQDDMVDVTWNFLVGKGKEVHVCLARIR